MCGIGESEFLGLLRSGNRLLVDGSALAYLARPSLIGKLDQVGSPGGIDAWQFCRALLNCGDLLPGPEVARNMEASRGEENPAYTTGSWLSDLGVVEKGLRNCEQSEACELICRELARSRSPILAICIPRMRRFGETVRLHLLPLLLESEVTPEFQATLLASAEAFLRIEDIGWMSLKLRTENDFRMIRAVAVAMRTLGSQDVPQVLLARYESLDGNAQAEISTLFSLDADRNDPAAWPALEYCAIHACDTETAASIYSLIRVTIPPGPGAVRFFDIGLNSSEPRVVMAALAALARGCRIPEMESTLQVLQKREDAIGTCAASLLQSWSE